MSALLDANSSTVTLHNITCQRCSSFTIVRMSKPKTLTPLREFDKRSLVWHIICTYYVEHFVNFAVLFIMAKVCRWNDAVVTIAVVSDEQCMQSGYRCGSGECVAGKLLCDGMWNCRDGSDERNCRLSGILFLFRFKIQCKKYSIQPLENFGEYGNAGERESKQNICRQTSVYCVCVVNELTYSATRATDSSWITIFKNHIWHNFQVAIVQTSCFDRIFLFTSWPVHDIVLFVISLRL